MADEKKTETVAEKNTDKDENKTEENKSKDKEADKTAAAKTDAEDKKEKSDDTPAVAESKPEKEKKDILDEIDDGDLILEEQRESARRLIDFLSGVAYSIDGYMQRVANNTFVVVPNNVDISGEQLQTPQPQRQINTEDIY